MDNPESTNSKTPWIKYLVEFLPIFLALLILMGRVYSQAYWKFFGLTPEQVNINFVDYSIISPNTTVASVFLALGVVIMLGLKDKPLRIGNLKPVVAYWLGGLSLIIGAIIVGLIPRTNLSNWETGTAGLVFGVGYLGFVLGSIVINEAALQFESKPQPQWMVKFNQWLRSIIDRLFKTKPHEPPKGFSSILMFFIIAAFSIISLWAMLDTSGKFGKDEALSNLVSFPSVVLQLDSSKGLGNLNYDVNLDGSVSLNVVIITTTNEFLFVSPGYYTNPIQLDVQAIPIARVLSYQYAVRITPVN